MGVRQLAASILLLSTVFIFGCVSSNLKGKNDMEKTLSFSLQGNVKEALLHIPESDSGLRPEDIELRENFKKRFVDRNFKGNRTGEPFVDSVIQIYEDYWEKVFNVKH